MLEDAIKAAILGTVQGLTEFLPVSSTGHLVLAEELLGVDEGRYGLAFDAALHLGTLAALLAYFGRRWLTLLAAGWRVLVTRSWSSDAEGRMAWLIVLGTLPAGLLGLVFESQIEDAFRSPWTVATMLIAFSAVFIIAEALGRQQRYLAHLVVLDAVVIGLAQAVALVPGVSRSGATISAGLLRGLRRADAATFAFLLSAPVVAAAGLRGSAEAARDFADGTLGRDDAVFFGTGMVFAAVTGYAAIAFLLRFLASNSLRPFVIYRVALGVAVLAALAVGQV